MSKPKYVPGPWKVQVDPKSKVWREVHGNEHPFLDNRWVVTEDDSPEGFHRICKVMDIHPQAATAELIAKAPEMAEELQTLRAEVLELKEALQACCELEESIKKAARQDEGHMRRDQYRIDFLQDEVARLKKDKQGD